MTQTVPDGLAVLDKPAGWTSHDVVGRTRRLAGTRKVGHAGTLDPMATGVLVLGVGRATRLLGHLAAHDKDYLATIRLGVTTVTDDAEGEVVSQADPLHVADLTGPRVDVAVAALTGVIDQVPSAVSAVKVDGVRSYARVRSGEDVVLAPRRVEVSRFEVLHRRTASGWLDLDVAVTVSSGTYVRALARDLGAALGVGGHLTALRRTRVGGVDLGVAQTLEAAAADGLRVVPLDEAVGRSFPRRSLDAQEALDLSHGKRLAPSGAAGVQGAFDPEGRCVALVQDRDGAARAVVVFRPA